jgi:hypothetical protein
MWKYERLTSVSWIQRSLVPAAFFAGSMLAPEAAFGQDEGMAAEPPPAPAAEPMPPPPPPPPPPPADEPAMGPGPVSEAQPMPMAYDAPAPEPPPAHTKTVGGHVGIATPLVTIADETTTIADQFIILNPIGIGIKVTDNVVIDFEMVVVTPVDPSGTTGLVIDPGVVYSWGQVAAGLRLAWQVNAESNFGLIPLVNLGLADFGGAGWFVEAAFPTFYQSEDVQFNAVLHTGVGF